jgi:protein-tyrosine phosphatase
VNLQLLTSLVFRVIVNCTDRCLNKYPDDFHYLQLNFKDDFGQNIFDAVFDTADFIHDQICNGFGVMVHCMAGKSRSSAVVIGYLMIKHDMSLREAYKHVALRRPKIAPNASFFIQLMKLEKALGKEPTLNMKQYAILVAISQKKAKSKIAASEEKKD